MSFREELIVNRFKTQAGNEWVMSGTAAPTTGTWKQGDIVWNSAPAAGGVLCWVCTTGGTTGGTWKTVAVGS